jgi:hypothetical protein
VTVVVKDPVAITDRRDGYPHGLMGEMMRKRLLSHMIEVTGREEVV